MTALHYFIFVFRIFFFVPYAFFYFLLLRHLPLPAVANKLLLWGMMGIPCIWWLDLQLDGVKRGRLAEQPRDRMPHPGSIIAANFTSPVDALYLAAVFDPIFTMSHPNSRKVRRIGLFRAILTAFSRRQYSGLQREPDKDGSEPPEWDDAQGLTSLRALVEQNPGRVIAVFPESGTTNGRGILPFSPSLLGASAQTTIFPVSIRYSPSDITTPVPGFRAFLSFLWKLLSQPTSCVRVRIAQGVRRSDRVGQGGETAVAVNGDETLLEQRFLDQIADTLARLGRNARVGLTLKDKARFVEAWQQDRR